MSDLGDKLSQAIEKRNNDITLWTWVNKNGDSIKLVDMTEDELQRAYTHTLDMLYRKTNYKFGKYEVRKNIKKLYTSCNAELFHRYLQYDLNIDLFKTDKSIIDYVTKFKDEHNITNEDSICEIFSNVPREFEDLIIQDLLKACLDSLEPINRRLISNEFIMSLGIWLTEDEKKELTEFDEKGKLRPWLQVMKERMFIDGGFFRVTPTGLSYAELRALLNLESRAKVSTVPSSTLKLLRDKILLLLDNDLEYHIKKWTTLEKRIEAVASFKNWKLINKYDNTK